MRIVRHRLILADGQPAPFLPSPNAGGTLRPVFLVLHYTAAADAASAVRWFQNPAAQASAHLVIGWDGAVTQMVPFDQVAWHAGESSWLGYRDLNQWSIGIELDNAGKLQRQGSLWRSWFGQPIPPESVLEAGSAGWQLYPAAQLERALEVAALLVRSYGLQDVLGHSEIAPGRKFDPGPAFPMGSFRAKAMGRSSPGPVTTSARVNIRGGPGTEFATTPGSPLPPGTPVAILEQSGVWCKVDVLTTVQGVADAVGWVHSRFLKLSG